MVSCTVNVLFNVIETCNSRFLPIELGGFIQMVLGQAWLCVKNKVFLTNSLCNRENEVESRNMFC